jgi:predicted component of type VI protein secretion system
VSDLSQLTAGLDQLRRLLEKSGDTIWPQILQSVASRLWNNDSRQAALDELKKFFGGMGSLNDIFFCEQNQNIPAGYTEKDSNAELAHLLDKIFREASLFGASPEDRSEWSALEASSELPPRIQNAFRKRES